MKNKLYNDSFNMNIFVSYAITFAIIMSLLYIFRENEFLSILSIVYAYIIFGYGHFIVGFKYQYLDSKRKGKRNLNVLWLWFFIAIIVGHFVINMRYHIFELISVTYFLIHGSLNLPTIRNKLKETGDFSALIILSNPITFLIYLDTVMKRPNEYEFIFDLIVEYLFYIFIIGIGIYSIYRIYKNIPKGKFIEILSILILLAATYYVINNFAINALIIIGVSLISHFISWQILYYQIYSKEKNKTKLKKYNFDNILIHGIIVIIVGINIYMFQQDFNVFRTNLYIFFYLSFMHVTLSYLNEGFVKKIFKIV